MDWYKRYIGDYQRDTGTLTIAEHGVYNLLLDQYYAAEGPLPSDVKELNRLCRATTALERAAVKKVADRFFPLRNGERRNKRSDQEIRKAAASLEEASAAGRKGAEKRWGKHGHPNGHPNSDPNGDPIPNPNGGMHGHPNGHPNGVPHQNPNGVSMASQTPDSRLQTGNKNSVPPERVNPARRVADSMTPGRSRRQRPQVEDPEADRVKRALTLLEADPKCTEVEAAKMCHVSVDAIREARRT